MLIYIILIWWICCVIVTAIIGLFPSELPLFAKKLNKKFSILPVHDESCYPCPMTKPCGYFYNLKYKQPSLSIPGLSTVSTRHTFMSPALMLVTGQATILLGKNTMMRKAIRGHMDSNPNLEKLLPNIKQNVGFVFTNKDLTEIRDMILMNKVPAAARAGALAPVSCTVPAQVTPLGPEKTSFFQALQIPTKISRGNIEILVSDLNHFSIMLWCCKDRCMKVACRLGATNASCNLTSLLWCISVVEWCRAN